MRILARTIGEPLFAFQDDGVAVFICGLDFEMPIGYGNCVSFVSDLDSCSMYLHELRYFLFGLDDR